MWKTIQALDARGFSSAATVAADQIIRQVDMPPQHNDINDKSIWKFVCCNKRPELSSSALLLVLSFTLEKK